MHGYTRSSVNGLSTTKVPLLTICVLVVQTLQKQHEKDQEVQRLQDMRAAENARRALERKLELKTKLEKVCAAHQ